MRLYILLSCMGRNTRAVCLRAGGVQRAWLILVAPLAAALCELEAGQRPVLRDQRLWEQKQC